MPHLDLSTEISATAEVCFDLSLDVDLHTQSTGVPRRYLIELLERRNEFLRLAAEAAS